MGESSVMFDKMNNLTWKQYQTLCNLLACCKCVMRDIEAGEDVLRLDQFARLIEELDEVIGTLRIKS